MLPTSDLLTAVMASLPDLGTDWVPLSGGRTNAVWRVGRIVIKAYDTSRATFLFANRPQDEYLALSSFGSLGMAPIVLAHGEDWIAYCHIEGKTWTSDPVPVANLLGRLHSLPPGGLQFARRNNAPAAIVREAVFRANMAGLESPSLQPPEVATQPPSIVHGDAVPGNIVMAHGNPILIDWQCPAIADPVEDLAMFLSPAMQKLYRGAPMTDEEASSFLSVYPHAPTVARYLALKPWLHLRIAAHCAERARRGDTGYDEACRLEYAFTKSAASS